MIPIPDTVVNKHAVMVKFLHATIAKIAVVCFFGPQGATWYANIVEVVVILDQLNQKIREIRQRLDIAWIHHREAVEHNSRDDENCLEPKCDHKAWVVTFWTQKVIVRTDKAKNDDHK